MPKHSRKYMQKFLDERYFLKSKFALVLFIGLIKSGIWVFPAIAASFALSRDPFSQPFSDPASQYLATSWLGSFLAHLVGIREFSDFITLHMTFAFLVPVVLYHAIRRNLSRNINQKVFLLSVLIPGIFSSFYWVGMDSLTLLLMCFSMLWFRYWQAQVVIGALLGLQHFEIALVGSATLVIYYLICGKEYRGRFEVSSSVSLMMSVILGKLVQLLIFAITGVEILESRFGLGLRSLGNFWNILIENGFAILWSGFGALWIVVILLVQERNRQSLAFLIASLVVWTSILFVQDHSRVLQLSFFMLTFRVLTANSRFSIFVSNRMMIVVIGTWLIAPWVWVWQEVRYWVTPFTIEFILAQFFSIGTLPDLSSITMWPFS